MLRTAICRRLCGRRGRRRQQRPGIHWPAAPAWRLPIARGSADQLCQAEKDPNQCVTGMEPGKKDPVCLQVWDGACQSGCHSVTPCWKVRNRT